MTDRNTSQSPLRLRDSEIRTADATPGRELQNRRSARERPGVGGLIAAAAALSVGIVVAGCGRPAPSTPPRPPDAAASVVVRSPTVTATGEPSWTVRTVDSRDPDDVLIATAEVLYTYAPAVDDAAGQAFDRARPLLSRSCQQRLGASTTGLTRFTGATWQRWRTARAVVTAAAILGGDDHPPDTATTHARVVTVTQTVHSIATELAGPAGDPIVLYMVAGRGDSTGGWRVGQLNVR